MKDRQLTHQDHHSNGKRNSLVLLLDGVTDPVNVGGLFRIADALGVASIQLCGDTVVPPHRKLSRVARATDKAVAYEHHDDSLEAARGLKEAGYHLLALELSQHSVDLRTADVGGCDRLCVVLGGEQSGVSAGLLEFVDQTVHIPMLGQNSSMNVTVACAIAVYELTRNLP